MTINRFYYIFVFGFCALLVVGCSKIPQVDDCCVSAIVERRINKRVKWNQGCWEDDQINWTLNRMMENELTIDAVVQIAFLNNPEIQAIFEEIGIAQADLVQAGLLQNPIFDGMVRFPDKRHATINTEFSIAQNFLDFLLIPFRKKIAESELEQARFRVAHAVINLAFDVQKTFYSLQAEYTKLALMKSLVEISEAASQLAMAQREQGNINNLEFQSRKNEFLETKIEVSRSQAEIVRLREKMNKLLGFRSETCWTIDHTIPVFLEETIPVACLEEIALSQRLDLEVARWEVERLARMAGIKQWWTYTGAILGISSEMDPEGIRATGPSFSVELPLFNYGQADRTRIHAMLRQSLQRLKAMEISVLSEVRSISDQLIINTQLLKEYRNEIIPLQHHIVSTSQRYYNDMALSVYKLLNAKKQEIQMQINYSVSLKDYWISRIDLDQAIGGNLHRVLINPNIEMPYCNDMEECQ